MSPPLPVTEDTPPDMLTGAMDLLVVLPNGRHIKMSVQRSIPMMDLLVHVTAANKISPSGHIIQAIGERGVLPYKPSTPIGALDTWTIHIIPKKQAANAAAAKKKLIPVNVSGNTPFEQTFRLQVHLPRNQLYVTRIGFKTRLADIMQEVCQEKGLDISKYCLTSPDKLEEPLDLEKTFFDYKLQQVVLISKNSRPVGLSSADIMAFKYSNENKSQNNAYASHLCEGSVSSGSLEGRSLSPARSDESSSSPTIAKPKAPIPRPYRKRRPAPKPPQNSSSENIMTLKKNGEAVMISHSRNSSDSSGYHESSVLSESPESNSLPDSLKRRSKLPSANSSTDLNTCARSNASNPSTANKIGSNLSRSLSNLATIAESSNLNSRFLSNGMKHSAYSASSTSLASFGVRRKKAPAPPPPVKKPLSMLSLKEEEVITSATTTSSSQCSLATLSIVEDRVRPTSYDCDRTSSVEQSSENPTNNPSLSSCARLTNDNHAVDNYDHSLPSNRSLQPNNSNSAQGSVDFKTPLPSTVHQKKTEEAEIHSSDLIMDDEEIDRIFHDATKDYETPSLCCLPSPPVHHLVTTTSDAVTSSINNESDNTVFDWQYRLPAPPSEFRDDHSSDDKQSAIIIMSTGESSKKPVATEDNVAQDAAVAVSTSASENVIVPQSTVITSAVYSRDKTTDYYSRRADNRRNSGNEMITTGETVCKRNSDDNGANEDEESSLMPTSEKDHIIGIGNDLNSITTNDSGLGSDDSSLPPCDNEPQRIGERPRSTATSDADHSYHPKKKSTTSVTRSSNVRPKSVCCGGILENFTISTYQSSKPTEIFRDDSVKTSKTTQLAIDNHPSAMLSKAGQRATSDTANGAAAAVSRHSSFNKQRPNAITPTVKRSKSNISLLSGNYAKFNRLLRKAAVSKNNEDDVDATNCPTAKKSSPSRLSEVDADSDKKYEHRQFSPINPLRKTNSEVGVNTDAIPDDLELLQLQEKVLQWKQRVLMKESKLSADTKDVSELQSLQVLRGILPQLNKSSRNSVAIMEEHQSNYESTKLDYSAARDNQKSHDRQCYRDPKPDLQEHAKSRKNSNEPAPPSINLKSWDERPKRQVSIKLDRDYVYGNNNYSNGNGYPSRSPFGNRSAQNVNIDNNNNNGNNSNGFRKNNKNNGSSDTSDNLSSDSRQSSVSEVLKKDVSCDGKDSSLHVPIVRAVEFKKPFTQKSVFANSYSARSSSGANTDVTKEQQKESIPSYLFGNNLYETTEPSFTKVHGASCNNKIPPGTTVLIRNERNCSLPSATSNNNIDRNNNSSDANRVSFDGTRCQKYRYDACNYNGEFKNSRKIQPKFDVYRDDRVNEGKNLVPPMAPSLCNAPLKVSAPLNCAARKPRTVHFVEDTRDNLLESIRSFNRDQLKRIRTK